MLKLCQTVSILFISNETVWSFDNKSRKEASISMLSWYIFQMNFPRKICIFWAWYSVLPLSVLRSPVYLAVSIFERIFADLFLGHPVSFVFSFIFGNFRAKISNAFHSFDFCYYSNFMQNLALVIPNGHTVKILYLKRLN